jgi:hypothetical protein
MRAHTAVNGVPIAMQLLQLYSLSSSYTAMTVNIVVYAASADDQHHDTHAELKLVDTLCGSECRENQHQPRALCLYYSIRRLMSKVQQLFI